MQPHRERPGSLAQPQGGQTALQETLCRFGLFRFFSNPESNQCDKLSRCFTEILWKTTRGRQRVCRGSSQAVPGASLRAGPVRVGRRALGGRLAPRGSVAGNGAAGDSAGQCAQVDEPDRSPGRGAGAQSALLRQLGGGSADGVVPGIVLAAFGAQPAPLRAARAGPPGRG